MLLDDIIEQICQEQERYENPTDESAERVAEVVTIPDKTTIVARGAAFR